LVPEQSQAFLGRVAGAVLLCVWFPFRGLHGNVYIGEQFAQLVHFSGREQPQEDHENLQDGALITRKFGNLTV
jgi:hypothetical protein